MEFSPVARASALRFTKAIRLLTSSCTRTSDCPRAQYPFPSLSAASHTCPNPGTITGTWSASGLRAVSKEIFPSSTAPLTRKARSRRSLTKKLGGFCVLKWNSIDSPIFIFLISRRSDIPTAHLLKAKTNIMSRSFRRSLLSDMNF